MGLATIDPHSQKEHTKIHKMYGNGDKRKNFTKKCMEIRTNQD